MSIDSSTVPLNQQAPSETYVRRAPAKPSANSLVALDWLNFFLADLQVSFGAFVAVYLTQNGWSQQRIGFVLTAGGIASMISLTPGGWLLDTFHLKRAMVALGLVMIAAGALMIALVPSYPLVLIAEILHGATAGLIGPAIAAISLGLVGHRRMSERLGRNNRFASAGNLLSAAAVGLISIYFAKQDMFFVAAGLAVPALVALSYLRGGEIDHARSRSAPGRDHRQGSQHLHHAVVNRCVLVLAAGSVLFQLGSASMLPLVGERLAATQGAASQLILSGCSVVPPIIAVLFSPWIGHQAEQIGRKPLLLIGFAALPVRAVLMALITNPYAIIAIQLLDGVSGAIIGLLTALVIADCTRGSGRFNFSQGFVGTAVGLGGAASTAISGFVAERFGFSVAFIGLAILGALGFAVIGLLLGESKPDYEKLVSPHVVHAVRHRQRRRNKRPREHGASARPAALYDRGDNR